MKQSEMDFIQEQLYNYGPTGNMLGIGCDDQVFNNLEEKFQLWKLKSVN